MQEKKYFCFYSQRQKLRARIHRTDTKKLAVFVVLIFFMNTLCMNSLFVFLRLQNKKKLEIISAFFLVYQ